MPAYILFSSLPSVESPCERRGEFSNVSWDRLRLVRAFLNTDLPISIVVCASRAHRDCCYGILRLFAGVTCVESSLSVGFSDFSIFSTP
jgi:hypothetical protein